VAVPVHAQDKERLRVLTAMQATYSLASALTKETGIDVVNIPEDGRSMQSLGGWLERRGDRLTDEFSTADAVITIGRTWPDDPLYTAARRFNIRIVNIDASKPWSTTMTGVSLIRRPGNDVPWAVPEGTADEQGTASHFWMSFSNAIRMADIIAGDLTRLAPSSAQQIGENLAALKSELLAKRQEMDDSLLELGDISLFALADEFIYLTNEFGIFVAGYFIRQDIQWTAEDLSGLSTWLRENKIRVVLHKWEPSDEIMAAIEDGGARLVVLQTGDPGIEEDGRLAADGYQRILQQNLQGLIEAFSESD
jgi:ABC-type Zn uptake system ZnuABC Zn-binding protein ZnuA